MAKKIKILFVEDNPSDTELLVRQLRQAGFAPEWTRVETEADFLAGLPAEWDLILSDYAMPEFNGLRALALLKESRRDLPFIIVSGSIGEDIAVAAMKQGAADYLLKDRLARLGTAVDHALEQSELRRARRRAEEEVQTQLQELQRWHEATLGREDRILQLKREVNQLLSKQDKPPRYASFDTP